MIITPAACVKAHSAQHMRETVGAESRGRGVAGLMIKASDKYTNDPAPLPLTTPLDLGGSRQADLERATLASGASTASAC